MPVCKKCKVEMTQDNTGIYCSNTSCDIFWQDQSWLDPYEENVRKVAKEIARDYFDKVLDSMYKEEYYDAWLQQQMPHFESAARIAVRRESEAFKAGWFGEIQDIESAYTLAPECERQLIERGLIPAPVDAVINSYADRAAKRAIPRNGKTTEQIIKEGSIPDPECQHPKQIDYYMSGNMFCLKCKKVIYPSSNE